MDNEANQEYFKRKKNKVSLAAWILINNNVLSQNSFLFLNAIDASLQLIVILCLYEFVGCSPHLSQRLRDFVYYEDGQILSMIVMIISVLLISSCIFIVQLILRDLDWSVYSEKRISYKLVGGIVTLFRGPAMGLTIILLSGGVQYSSQIEPSYLRIISLICAAISFMILLTYAYLGSYFINLASPTDLIPWADNSPYYNQISQVAQLFLLLTIKFSRSGKTLMYVLSAITVIMLSYKVYIMMFKTHITNEAYLNFMIFKDFAQIHMLTAFLYTMMANDQQTFIYFVVAFLPVTLYLGAYLQGFCMQMRFAKLISDQQQNPMEKAIAYRLLMQLYFKELEDENNKYFKLQKLQQIHIVRCKKYANTIEKKMKMGAIQNDEKDQLIGIEDVDVDYSELGEIVEAISTNLKIREQTGTMATEKGQYSDKKSQSDKLESQSFKNNHLLQSFAEKSVGDLQQQQHYNSLRQSLDKKNRKNDTYYNSTSYYQSENQIRKQQNVSAKNLTYQKRFKSTLKTQDKKNSQLRFDMQEFHVFESENLKEGLKKLVHHIFSDHLSKEPDLSFQLKLIKTYYIFKIIKNPYLAHFLLLDIRESMEKKDYGFIDTNVRLINQRYIEEIIKLQNQQEEDSSLILKGKLDLQNLLKVNQLFDEFDQQIEETTDEVHDFWTCLQKQRDTASLFTKGIKISNQLNHVQKKIEEIKSYQSEQELTIYMKMQQFYSNVVFKTSDCFEMQDKAKQHIQLMKMKKLALQKKINELGQDSIQEVQEKGLLLAEINLRDPMKITFVNKTGLAYTQYDQNNSSNLYINNLMPTFVSRNHHLYIKKFFKTGKSRFIKASQDLYMKQRSGCIVPAIVYLIIDSMTKNHLILMFEPNNKLKMFEEPHAEDPFSFLIADENFNLGEIAHNFEALTGINNYAIKQLENEKDRSLKCEDILTIQTYDCTIPEFKKDYEPQEVEVIFHSVQRNQIVTLNERNEASDNPFIEGKKVDHLVKTLMHKFNERRNLPAKIVRPVVYIMKITEFKIQGGKYHLNLLAFRKKPLDPLSIVMGHREIIKHETKVNYSLNLENQMDAKQLHLSTQSSRVINSSEISISKVLVAAEPDFSYELQSESSIASLSSTSSTNYQAVSTYFQKVNSETTPKTLKFILNIFLFLISVMLVASSVVLTISLKNQVYSLSSLNLCKNSNQALQELTTLRFLVRSIVNIYQGNDFIETQYLKDRLENFETLILKVNSEMLYDKIMINTQGQTTISQDKNIQDIKTYFLSMEGSFFSLSQTISEGLTLLHNKINDVFTNPDRKGILRRSELVYLNLTSAAQKNLPSFKNMSLLERDTYFIINNTNGNLFSQLDLFIKQFSTNQLSNIHQQISYLTGVCLGMMAGILVLSFVVIPLFQRIQHRILELMKIFFTIEPAIKKNILSRIQTFQQRYYAHKLMKRQQQQMNQREEEEEKRENENDQINKKYDPEGILLKKITIKQEAKEGKKEKKNNSKKVMQAFGLDSNHTGALEDIMKVRTMGGENAKNSTKGRDSDKQVTLNHKEELEEQIYSSSSEETEEYQNKIKENFKKQTAVEIADAQQLNTEQEREVIEEFRKFIFRRKFFQGLFIFILLCFMASYFLINYFQSMRLHTNMVSSYDHLKLIFERQSCPNDVMNFYMESYFLTGGVNPEISKNLQSQLFLNLQDKINECMEIEMNFQKTIIEVPEDYFSAAKSILQSSESGEVCTRNTSSLGQEQCLRLSEQIKKQGMTTFYFNVYQQIKQMQLNLVNVLKQNTYNAQFARNQILSRISPLTDILLMVLYPVQLQIQEEANHSVQDFFKKDGSIQTIIFCLYIAATILISVLFITNIYLKLRREMLLSNKILYLIDFQQINDLQKNSIIQFLQNY